MRRAATVLLTAALTAGGLAALAAAGLRATSRREHLTITVTNLGPGAPHLPRSTPTSTSRPASTPPHPAPALLVTNGFGGTKDDQADLAQGFGEQGYVTLSYTGLGFVDGDNCPITLDDREHDGAAASQLIRFLGGDPAIAAVDDDHRAAGARRPGDPRGRRRPAPATTRGRHDRRLLRRPDPVRGGGYEHEHGTNRLDAIVPLITWNDLSYSLAPENSGLPQGTARSGSVSSTGTGVFKYQWAVALHHASASPTAPRTSSRSAPTRHACRHYVDQQLRELRRPGLHGAARGRHARATRARPRSPSCGTTRSPAT